MACVEDKLEMDVDLTGLNDSHNAATFQRRSTPVQNRHNPRPSCGTAKTKTSSRKSDGSVNDDGKIRKKTSRQVSDSTFFIVVLKMIVCAMEMLYVATLVFRIMIFWVGQILFETHRY